MKLTDKNIFYLHDDESNLQGVLLSPELWEKVKPHVEELFGSTEKECTPEVFIPEEATKDWKLLLQYWDFPYEPDFDVTCDECGNKTENWSEDSPRKFILRSANLGGLVTFHCMNCHSRINKRHFNKEITSDTTPFCKKKDPKQNAFYG